MKKFLVGVVFGTAVGSVIGSAWTLKTILSFPEMYEASIRTAADKLNSFSDSLQPAKDPMYQARGYSRFSKPDLAHNEPDLSYQEVTFNTREDAEAVISTLCQMINTSGTAVLADLQDLIDLPSRFADQNWGWIDLRGSYVAVHANGRFMLNLPKPERL